MNTPHPTSLTEIINLLIKANYAKIIKDEAQKLGISIDSNIIEALLSPSPSIALIASLSGGKDSACMILLVNKFLTAIHYTGEKIICHADLGEIEHIESMQEVERVARFVGWKLKIVRREKGGLLERFSQRWQDNCRRWANLQCVNLISPFPSANGRYCTSELKIAPITQAAVKLFPKALILNLIGLRAEESAKRAKNPISKPNNKLSRADGTRGRDWFPILDTKIETVWLTHHNEKFPRHPQYDRGNQRVSCAYCFLASKNDWEKGAAVPSNQNSYRHIVELEIRSTFSYRQHDWLADIRPAILSAEFRNQITSSKEKAVARRLIESRIPLEVLFTNSGGKQGWPSFQPSMNQCEIIAAVRRDIAKLMGPEIERASGSQILYTTAQAVYDRYGQLLAQRQVQLTTQNRRANKSNKTSSILLPTLSAPLAQAALF